MSGASSGLEEPLSRVSDQPTAGSQPEASGSGPTTRRLSEILSDSSSSAAGPLVQRLSEMLSDSSFAGGSFIAPLPSPAAQETPQLRDMRAQDKHQQYARHRGQEGK